MALGNNKNERSQRVMSDRWLMMIGTVQCVDVKGKIGKLDGEESFPGAGKAIVA